MIIKKDQPVDLPVILPLSSTGLIEGELTTLQSVAEFEQFLSDENSDKFVEHFFTATSNDTLINEETLDNDDGGIVGILPKDNFLGLFSVGIK